MLTSAASRSIFSSPFSLTFSPPKHRRFLTFSYSKSSIRMASTSVVEHIVLFKVKENTSPSNLGSMLSSLNALASLDSVLHIAAAPLRRVRSSPIPFTHMLHSRYSSKDDLAAYAAHPSHVAAVKENVLPICDDVMAVDWIAADFEAPVAISPGSSVRVTFLKLKEGLGEGVKEEIIGVIRGIKGKFGGIDQLTCGENFSPARAKGYSIASLAVFPGVGEMDAVDANEELVNLEKEKVRDYLESVIVLDYVVPSPEASSL